MEFWTKVLQLLDTQMETPACYGLYHIVFLALMLLATIYLCVFRKADSADRVRKVVFVTALIVIVLEVYKMINYSFSYADGKIAYDFQWYAFPFQFCSTPMYVGLLAGLIKKGKVHDALCAYLATYAMFAGLITMVIPNDIYIDIIGINIQTSICHGSMIMIAIYLLYTGYVKLEHKTILKAMSVFACTMGVAMILNEIAFHSGLEETFNMLFISPHQAPSLLVYSDIQKVVPFPFCTIIYFLGFTLAAYLILLAAIGISKLCSVIRKKKSTAESESVAVVK
jgi:hypothetical protein